MEQFILQLLADKGLPEGLDEDVRQQLVKDLVSRAADLVNRRMIEAMSEQDVNAFNELLDGDPSPEQVQQFIEAHVPEKEEVASRALLEFRSLYLGAAA
jgi:hypothetical protein